MSKTLRLHSVEVIWRDLCW